MLNDSTSSENALSISPFRIQLSREFKFSDLTDDALVAIISKLDICDLSNFAAVSVMCKALAENVFDEIHGNRLDFTNKGFKCTNRGDLNSILKQFGYLSKSVLVNMHTFRDAFDSNTALKWIADSCGPNLKYLQLKKFNLNLEAENDSPIQNLMSNLEELVIIDGSLAHCGAFFDGQAHNLKRLAMKNVTMDETTKICFEAQTALQTLSLNDIKSNGITIQNLSELLSNNLALENLELATNTALPYSFAKNAVALTNLSYTVTPKNKIWLNNGNIEENYGELSTLADAQNLQRLQLSAYRGFRIQPLIDRLANHDKIMALDLTSVRVNNQVFQQLINYKYLQSIKLSKVVCTEVLPHYMKYFNQMAAGQLNEIHIVFEQPINVDNLVYLFTHQAYLHTWQVIEKENYAEAIMELANLKETQPKDGENVIVVWPKGIIWRKNDLEIVIDDKDTGISLSP